MYEEGIRICREKQIPVIFHVEEVTQPLGHSTSGSHERYKTPERLEWEIEFDPIKKMRNWMIEAGIASEEEIAQIEDEASKDAKDARIEGWKSFINPICRSMKSG